MIFCVEDDVNICDLILYTLRSAGFDAQGFADGVSFFSALENTQPELILLDIMLPGQDGIEILKILRRRRLFSQIPIIMTTAKGAEYDKVIALDCGADDYLVKPFGMMELISRVKALLRRTGNLNSRVLIAGPILMDANKRETTVHGEKVVLTLKEFDLLYYLILNCGLVMTREKLLNQVWGFTYYGETRTVDMHIRSLRMKLGDAAEMIETIRGMGYKVKD